MLAGKKILIGISGSIAAYKIPYLVRMLVKEGAEVKVVMTPASKDFVSKLTLSTLSRNPVIDTLFDEGSWSNHVMLGRWADIMVIAPLSCHTLSKMATGLCDNMLMATYLSSTCPVVAAPAMDEDMWHHPTTEKNLATLLNYGNLIIPAEHGELASGLTGEGRMAEPETIVAFLNNFFSRKHSLAGKKALVTAGPTYEAIDPVRFIGNHSSGKMGYAIAEELSNRGAEVVLVSGPVGLRLNNKNIKLIKVTTAREMYEACMQEKNSDIAVLAAAVADYAPATIATRKIKKSDGELTLALKKTDDILAAFGKQKTENQVVVGFALETHDEDLNARKKLENKNADMIVLNSLNDDGAGFGKDTNKITLYFKNNDTKAFEKKSKALAARDIVNAITELLP